MTHQAIHLKVHTKDNARESPMSMLTAAVEKLGFIPNVLRQMNEAPVTLQGEVQLTGLLEQASHTPTE